MLNPKRTIDPPVLIPLRKLMQRLFMPVAGLFDTKIFIDFHVWKKMMPFAACF
jgi:hypothetical protein